VRNPVEPQLLEAIAALDVERDLQDIRAATGAAIDPPSLFTLRVCTYLLQRCVLGAGWTLHDVANVMTRQIPEAKRNGFGELDGDTGSSELERIVWRVMERLRQQQVHTYPYWSPHPTGARSPRQVRPMPVSCAAEVHCLWCLQVRTAEDDHLLTHHGETFMQWVQEGIDELCINFRRA
jgi:hypothetical protein